MSTNIEAKELAVLEARENADFAFRQLSDQILGLLPTAQDALERMSGQLEELNLEASVELFQDFNSAVQTIVKSLPAAFFEKRNIDELNPFLADICESVESLVGKYEAQDILAIKSCLDSGLKPRFKAFRRKLEDSLQKAFPFS